VTSLTCERPQPEVAPSGSHLPEEMEIPAMTNRRRPFDAAWLLGWFAWMLSLAAWLGMLILRAVR
jgi:hypothetical protein